MMFAYIRDDVRYIEHCPIFSADWVFKRSKGNGTAIEWQPLVKYLSLILVSSPLFLPLFAGKKQTIFLVLLLSHGSLCSGNQGPYSETNKT